MLLGLSLLAVLLAAAACQAGPLTVVTGSGTLRSEARPVAAIDEVELAGVGALTITQGPQESLTVEAEDNLLPEIRSEVRGRRLVLGPAGGKTVSLRPTRPIRYTVTVRDLTALKLSGAGKVEVAGLTTARLDVRLSGAGTISLNGLAADQLTVALAGFGDATASGTVGRQEVTLSSAGSYRAERLASREARVTASGAGDATVRVSDVLSVKVSGPSTVEYIGDPAVDQQTTGTGHVKQRAGR
jgi:hypothetical protein